MSTLRKDNRVCAGKSCRNYFRMFDLRQDKNKLSILFKEKRLSSVLMQLLSAEVLTKYLVCDTKGLFSLVDEGIRRPVKWDL